MKFVRTKRERLLFASTMIVVIGVLGYFFVFEHLQALWATMGEETENLEFRLEQTKVQIETDKRAESRYLAMKESLEIQGSPEEQSLHIMNEITEIFEGNGVVARTAKPLTSVPYEKLTVFLFQFSNVECPFDALVTLLKSMDDESSVLEVEDLKIEDVSEREGALWIRADMKVSRLVYGQGKDDRKRS